MLKEIISFWKGESFMNGVVQEFGEMISDAEYVFNASWEALKSDQDPSGLKASIYEKDKAVNHKERDIRRKLIKHLSINPKEDTSGCLAIMSLVKDVERIGDYSKNIFDLRIMLGTGVSQMKYASQITDIESTIATHFPMLKEAFLNSDGDVARKILSDYMSVKEASSKLLKELFEDELPTKETAATVLLSRYLKRINSHISNVATGIISPIDQIDFVRGDLLE